MEGLVNSLSKWVARETSLQLKSRFLSFGDYAAICFHFVPSSSFSVWLAFHFSPSCSASPSFSPACSLWGNPWQIKLRRTYQRQITSCALRKALLHQSARVLRRASSLQCLTCELDMHPTEEEVEKWYPHYSKWIKNISLTNTPDYILLYAPHTHTSAVMAAIYATASESTAFVLSPKWVNIKIIVSSLRCQEKLLNEREA